MSDEIRSNVVKDDARTMTYWPSCPYNPQGYEHEVNSPIAGYTRFGFVGNFSCNHESIQQAQKRLVVHKQVAMGSKQKHHCDHRQNGI